MKTNAMTSEPISTKELNANYLIRFYPKSDDRKAHRLIGTPTFYELIPDPKLRTRVLSRVISNPDNKTVVRLRRGVEFVFYYR